jgi:hypothetical protein
MGNDAKRADRTHAATPYERAIAIAKATKENLGTYPSIRGLGKKRILSSQFIQLAFMDTVSGLLTPQ